MKARDKWLPIILPLLTFILCFSLIQVNKISLTGMILAIIFPIIFIIIITLFIIWIIEDRPFFYKLDTSIRKAIKGIIIIASIVFVCVFLSTEPVRNTFLDIPDLYNKNYERIEGQVILVFNHEGGGLRTRTWYTEFTIKDTRFSIDRELFIPVIEEGFYSVKYLPHSKMVIEISEVASNNK